MLQRAHFCSLLIALSGCGEVTIDAAYDAGSDSEDDAGSETTPSTTQLDETLARYANEVAGEWYGLSPVDGAPVKMTLSPSATQPRTGSAEFKPDCPANTCPPDADGGRPRMIGPGESVVGEYWFLKLKGQSATVIIDGPFPSFLPITGSCSYLPAPKKIDCGVIVYLRTRAP